jgi:DNA-binding Lrp family transcriptional regulator
MVLDELDRRILSQLDFGPRQGLSALVRELDTTPQILDYRLKSLQKKGVLIGFRAVIDSFRLGFLYCRLFVRLNDTSEKSMNEIARFANKTPQVMWCYQMLGDYDLVVSFWCHSVSDFERLSFNFLTKHGSVIADYNQDQIYRLRHCGINQLLGTGEQKIFDIQECSEQVAIDELDTKILRVLSTNSRLPYSSIAERCETSDKVVAYRIERLEDRGVICGYRPILDWSLLGYSHFKLFIRLDLSIKGIVEKVNDYIYSTPEVFCSLNGFGFPGELDVELVFESYPKLFDYMEQLRRRFPKAIKGYKHMQFTTVHKVNYLPC